MADQIRHQVPKIAAIMYKAVPEVLAYLELSKERRAKLQSAAPVEQLEDEISRSTEVVGILLNDDAIIRSSRRTTIGPFSAPTT